MKVCRSIWGYMKVYKWRVPRLMLPHQPEYHHEHQYACNARVHLFATTTTTDIKLSEL